MILKENRKLVKEFKNNSEYKLKEGGVQNAFDLIQTVIEEGGPENGVDEEELDLYFDDLEDEFEREED